jgi:hypothetical protein
LIHSPLNAITFIWICFLGLLNLDEYLSYAISYIVYSPHGTTSKSSTKASGDSPEEVKLWDDFLGGVNNNTFDQEKKFQRPIFLTDFIKTCERNCLGSF